VLGCQGEEKAIYDLLYIVYDISSEEKANVLYIDRRVLRPVRCALRSGLLAASPSVLS
jgi:hypothetical protein